MSMLRLIWKQLIARPLNALLSLVLLGLGVGLVAFVIQVQALMQERVESNIKGIDMVVGAKGSPMQLILSAVFQVDAPTGNIAAAELDKLRKHPLVHYVIPLAYGDSYRGTRILGTNAQYMDLLQVAVQEGRQWSAPFEVLVGASAARTLGLKVGDTFEGSHGLVQGGETHHAHPYVVVGSLAPSGRVVDQLILTSVESVWNVHAQESTVETASPELTAGLVKFRNAMGMMLLPRMVNQGTPMQAAVPRYELERLMDLFGVGFNVLSMLARLIMLVAGVSLFISLYTSLRTRMAEMALLRAYGASRRWTFGLLLGEGVLLALFGGVLGLVISRIGLWYMQRVDPSRIAAVDLWEFQWPGEVWLLLITLSIGALAALIPAWQVYRNDIAKTLSDA